MIVCNEQSLRQVCDPVRDVKEGGEVARKLTNFLRQQNKRAHKQARKGKEDSVPLGVGLAAPQIGIRKQVAVLFTTGVPFVLMNPVVVEKSKELIPFREGCLSFPGRQEETWRHQYFTVKCLNSRYPIVFGSRDSDQIAKYLLNCVIAQHEISHLFGLLFMDFTNKDSSPWDNVPELRGSREAV